MPRGKKLRDLNREREVLSSPVRMDGKGEDPVVQKLVSDEFATMPNADAVDIGLALNQLIRGQASMLQNQDAMADEIRNLKAKMSEYDEAERRWATDREKFLTEVAEKANKLRITDPIQKAKMEGQQSVEFTKEVQAARATIATDKLQFDDLLNRMPKTTVMSAGRLVMTSSPNGPKPKIVPEVIKIRHRTWVLPPNKMVEVPELVAKVMQQKAQEREASDALKEIIDADRPRNEADVAQGFRDLNKKYWADKSGESFPVR